MPFKLKLKKSRQYNVSSKNLLVISVELLDNTTVECTLSSHSLGQECLSNVCQRLGLLQPQYFGLRFISKKGTSWWVDLGRPLKRQLDKYAQENCSLSLGVMYFVSDVNLLHDEVTRYHYFLQLKADIIEGKLQCSEEQIILFASYSLQAEFGDHDPERHTTEYLTNFGLLPKNMSRGKQNQEAVLERVISMHRSLQGLSQPLAEVYYIMEAQHLDGYGQECFAGKDSSGTTLFVGVSLIGIFVKYMNEEPPLYFQWDHIINLVHHKRCFGIEHRNSAKVLQVFLEDSHLAKYVWKTCIRQHRFYTQNETLPSYRSSTNVHSSPQNKQEFSENRNHIQESQESLDGLGVYHTEGAYSECIASSTSYSQMMLEREQMPEPSPPIATDSFQSQLPPSPVAPSQTSHLASSQPVSHSTLYSSSPHQSQTDISTYHQQNVCQQQFECKDHSSLNIRCMVLPVYRQAPDYDTAVRLKYGIQSRSTGDIVPSSPLIQSHSTVSSISQCDLPQAYPSQTVIQHQSYAQYKNYSDLSHLDIHDPSRETVDPVLTRNFEPICSTSNHPAHTYSSPELASQGDTDDISPVEKKSRNVQIMYQFKPPPPYPYKTRPSSSTPDLTKSYQQPHQTNSSPDLVSRKNANMISKITSQHVESTDPGIHFGQLVQDSADSRSPAKSTSGTDYLQNCALSLLSTSVEVTCVDSNNCSKHTAANADSFHSKSLLQNAISSQNHPATQDYLNHKSSTLQIPVMDRTYVADEAAVPVTAVTETEKSAPDYVSLSSEFTRLQSIPLSPLRPSASYIENRKYPSVCMTPMDNLQINKTVNLATQVVDSQSMGPMLVAAMNGLILSRPDVITPSSEGKKFPKDTRIQALEGRLEEGQVFLEFERIIKKKPMADFCTAVLPENMSRNRFKDVFPYEENRVHLTPTKENRTGYINASHITVTVNGTPRSYIGAQGPLPNTLYSFWQMIWEHHVCVVVMLTEVQEQGKDKCFPYWPQEENNKVQIGEFQIIRNFSMSSPTYITCSLSLCHLISCQQRTVWHIQYTDWPDHSCPQDLQGFINFMGEIDAVRRHALNQQPATVLHTPPVVVHCSAGVGRSGVVILCDIMLYALDHNQSIDIPKVLTQLRLQRMLTVQTLAQYKFVYTVLIQYLKNSRLI